MKKIIIILLVLIGNFCNIEAQETIVIHGKIIDESTGDGIPFATIEIMGKGIGTAANTEGKFDFETSKININDTLTISSLGYKQKTLTLNELLSYKDVQINLLKKVYFLPEVTISNSYTETLQLGNYKKSTKSGYRMSVGHQIAVFMENTENHQGIIKSVNFYIVNKSRFSINKPKTPFRVRIYKVDTLTNNPGEDLLTESIIVKPKRSGWFTVDLSEYDLPVSIEGFFVAMEWILTDEKYYYKAKIHDHLVKGYGQELGNYFDTNIINTWTDYLGKGWRKHTKKNGKSINALIFSEIQLYK
jgi:hypothetical protein